MGQPPPACLSKVGIDWATNPLCISCALNQIASLFWGGKCNLGVEGFSGSLCSHRTPEWPHFTPLRKQFSEWQIDWCMGGYQKRIYFISYLSCKVESFLKTLSKCHRPGVVPLAWREDLQTPQVKSCCVWLFSSPWVMSLGCAAQPEALWGEGEGGGHEGSWAPKGCCQISSWCLKWLFFFFFYIPRENENVDIHTHERPCTDNSAFPFEKEIENIPRLIFF